VSYDLLNYELMQETRPRTWWEVLWDAVRGIFVRVIYAIIDGMVRIVKRFIWDVVYGTWREE